MMLSPEAKRPNNTKLENDLNTVICRINNKWFQNNLITLNLNKTYFIQFINKSIGNCDIKLRLKTNIKQQSKKLSSN
jgi:hypothetical protein